MKVYYVRHEDGVETRLPETVGSVAEASNLITEQWPACGMKVLIIREYKEVSEKSVQVNTHYRNY